MRKIQTNWKIEPKFNLVKEKVKGNNREILIGPLFARCAGYENQ